MCSKLRRMGRGTRRRGLCSVSESTPEFQQGCQWCSQRRRFNVFEPGNSDGAEVVTIKIFLLTLTRFALEGAGYGQQYQQFN